MSKLGYASWSNVRYLRQREHLSVTYIGKLNFASIICNSYLLDVYKMKNHDVTEAGGVVTVSIPAAGNTDNQAPISTKR